MTIAIICITVAFVLLLVQILHMKETIKYYDSIVKTLIIEQSFNNVINKRVFDDIKNGTYDINDFYFDEYCYQYSKFEDIPEELLEEDVKSFNVKWSCEKTKHIYLGKKIIVEME